jgi:hypothetical protein
MVEKKKSNVYEEEKKKVDFKNNIISYLKFVKEFKWYFVIVFIMVSILELTKLGERYLFKLLVDNSSLFTAVL